MPFSSSHLPPLPTPPPVPQPGATQPPAPPTPVPPAALLAALLTDGLVQPDTTKVDFFLSADRLVVNGQPQSAALLAKYRQGLGLAGSAAVITLRIG